MHTTKVIVCLKSDLGRVKIGVWASSLEEAKERVLRDQNAPESAVIYCRVAPLSIYDIKNRVEGPFFSRSTMRFFKQTLKSFSVYREGDGLFRIAAPSFGGHFTKRVYNPFTNKLS
jgi:hypothetical protein